MISLSLFLLMCFFGALATGLGSRVLAHGSESLGLEDFTCSPIVSKRILLAEQLFRVFWRACLGLQGLKTEVGLKTGSILLEGGQLSANLNLSLVVSFYASLHVFIFLASPAARVETIALAASSTGRTRTHRVLFSVVTEAVVLVVAVAVASCLIQRAPKVE